MMSSILEGAGEMLPEPADRAGLPGTRRLLFIILITAGILAAAGHAYLLHDYSCDQGIPV